jgi:acetyl-CoA synthetase
MPMIPEAAYAMLACARIGAVHSIVFGGFSPDALAGRIKDCDPRSSSPPTKACAAARGPAEANTDKACDRNAAAHTGQERASSSSAPAASRLGRRPRHLVPRGDGRGETGLPAGAKMNAEDPLFILYTSGSTGKPKGVLHTTGGYLVYAAMTHQYVFDYHDGDVYWCTADVGWVTGHSYIVYGPLANGATTLMFEGVPTYPDAGRFWEVVDKHKVNIFYTAPPPSAR